MVGPKDVGPGRLPGATTPSLNEQEQGKAAKEKSAKVRSKDASRLAQQAGFQRVGEKKKGRLSLGDSSGAPIPLPDDDVDGEAWSQQGLESAEQALGSAEVYLEQSLKEVEEGASGRTLGVSLLEGGFLPVEEDLERLQALSEREAALGEESEERLRVMGNSLGTLFGVAIGEDTPVAHRVMAAGLIVAGEPEGVTVLEGALDEKKLATGIQKVTSKGNKAVEKARTMNQGIGKELNVHRTMVFKR